MALSKLRLASNKLNIVTRRYDVNHEQHMRTLCNLREIEDDFHVVIKCSAYSAILCKYISYGCNRRPCFLTYVSLLQSSHFGTLNNLGKYIYLAFVVRKQLTNDN